jgi:hypothetical protein
MFRAKQIRLYNFVDIKVTDVYCAGLLEVLRKEKQVRKCKHSLNILVRLKFWFMDLWKICIRYTIAFHVISTKFA